MSTTVPQHEESVEVDSQALFKRLAGRRLVLQARSLVNTLNVLKRRLQQLQRQGLYTREDLAQHKRMLDDIDGRWRDEEGTMAGRLAAADPKTATLCSCLFNECCDMLADMEHSATKMPEDLMDMYKRLVALQSQLARMQADADHTLEEVLPLQRALDEIDAERLGKGGSFSSGEQPAVAGESACNEVLNHCYELLVHCVRQAQDVSPEMKDVYDQLRRIKNALRKLQGKRHHTVEDLRHYQSQLEKIDAQRKDGVFCGDPEKGVIPHGQAAASGLLEECNDLIEQLAGSAEDMSGDMREILGQLEQYRHQLEGMVRRECSYEEVREVHERLDTMDDERQAHAGIFAHSAANEEEDKPPPGQEVCSAVLNHCYRLLHDLYTDMAADDQ